MFGLASPVVIKCRLTKLSFLRLKISITGAIYIKQFNPFIPADQYRYLCKQFRSRWAVSSDSTMFAFCYWFFTLLLFATIDVSKFRDERIHFKYSGVKEYTSGKWKHANERVIWVKNCCLSFQRRPLYQEFVSLVYVLIYLCGMGVNGGGKHLLRGEWGAFFFLKEVQSFEKGNKRVQARGPHLEMNLLALSSNKMPQLIW